MEIFTNTHEHNHSDHDFNQDAQTVQHRDKGTHRYRTCLRVSEAQIDPRESADRGNLAHTSSARSTTSAISDGCNRPPTGVPSRHSILEDKEDTNKREGKIHTRWNVDGENVRIALRDCLDDPVERGSYRRSETEAENRIHDQRESAGQFGGRH